MYVDVTQKQRNTVSWFLFEQFFDMLKITEQINFLTDFDNFVGFFY